MRRSPAFDAREVSVVRLCCFLLSWAARLVDPDRRCWRASSLWPHRADPAPPRPSLAVGLFGTQMGEHALGTARCADHIPCGPGRETVPVGLCGQSRPNPTHGSSVGTADYFPATPELLPRHFARLGEIGRTRGERRRRSALGRAESQLLQSYFRRRWRSGIGTHRRGPLAWQSKITHANCWPSGGRSILPAAQTGVGSIDVSLCSR